ncbi:MAG: PAS domain S-box protein [Syntrophales bacterium]|nr:PAS domain S-box protein [Syntrophales bacterium]
MKKCADTVMKESGIYLHAFLAAITDLIIYRMSADWSEMHYLEGRDFIRDTDRPNRTWLDIYIHPDDREFVVSAINEAIKNRDIFELEHRVIRADGTVGWAYSRAVPLLDAEGKITEWMGTSKDITDRKKAEESLRKSETKYRELFNLIDEGFCIVEVLFDEKEKPVDYRFLELNPSFENQTGLKGAQGRRIRELAPRHEKHWFEIYGRIALTGEAARFQDWARSLHRFYDVYAWRYGDPKDRQVAILFKDITERKKAELEREKLLKRVDEERARLQAVMDALPVAVWVADNSGKMIMVNDAAADIYGGRAPQVDTVEEYSVYSLYRPDTRERIPVEEYPLPRALRGESVREMIIDFRRFDNKYGTQIASSAPIVDSEGNILGGICVATDITYQTRIEQKLRDLNETLEQQVAERTKLAEDRAKKLRALMGELAHVEKKERKRLANILHDNLQQPLIGARMNSEVLLSKVGGSEKQIAETILDLISQSIKISRSLTAELSPPFLKQGLTAASKWLGSWMEENYGLAVDLRVDTGADPGSGDMTFLLYQSVRELLFNVVKHAEVKLAHVRISRDERKRFRVTVSDQGIGFDPASLQDEERSGFGLVNVRERLELAGGKLEIKSSPGKGASFSLILPPEAAEEGSAKDIPVIKATVRKPKTTGRKIRVLLVDDHTVVRQGLSTMLKLYTDIHVVSEAGDGEKAVEKARKLQPDVILMDISMPGMGGVEATRIIHSEHPYIRIIGLSMHDSQDLENQMIKAGASAYCTKDGDTRILLSEIRGETTL